MILSKLPDMYGIRRLRSRGRAWGWRVVVARNGKAAIDKAFSDSKYGGEEASLAASRAYRDAMLKQHPPLQMREFRSRVRKHNTSGYPGVTLQTSAGKPQAFMARTQVRVGYSLARSFTIARYGWDNALCLALEARQQQLLQVEDAAVCSPSASALHESL